MAKWGENQFKRMQEARADAGARRQALTDRLRRSTQKKVEAASARQAEIQRFADIDVNAALSFLADVPFQRFDLTLENASHLNRAMLELVGHLLVTLSEQRSAAVLQWPSGIRDAAILHPLAMLAMLGSRVPVISGQHRWCAAVPDIRTLYFPYRGGGTGSSQRSWLVGRDKLLAANALHLTRTHAGQAEASEALSLLHVTLGHLSRLKLRDETMPHLAHPSLAELFPVFAAGPRTGGSPFAAARHELFGRVRHGAAIDRLTDHRATLSDPQQAPFAMFGIDARADVRAALASPALAAAEGGRSPDLCLLDLGPPGLNRLGPGWEEIVGGFLAILLAKCPALPVLAVTHDGYVQRRLAQLFRESRAARATGRAPLETPAVLRRTTDICMPDPPIETVSAIAATFQSTAGDSAMALAALAEAAKAMPDAATQAAIRRSSANLRRAVALPCGLRAAYDGLCALEGQAAAEAFLEERSEASVLGAVQQALASGVSGGARTRLIEAEAAIARAYAQLDADTPIGSAVAELAAGFARKVDFSILVFANPIDLKLAERRFSEDADVEQALRNRIARGLLKICHAGTLEEALAGIEGGDNRNSWKRLALIAPPIAFLDRLLVRAWLPEQFLIVCDRAFTGRVAGTYAPLARHGDFAGADRVGARMAVLAAAARKEAEARAVGPLNLILTDRPAVDAPDVVIDLVDADATPGETLSIALESGRTLRSRPGTAMIRYSRDAPINPFDRTLSRDLEPGDAIVVPDRAFVDAARRVLPVELLARNWVKVYHDMIVAALPGIEGATFSAKARTVHAALQRHRVRASSLGAVQEWLNAETYRTQPAEQMRPHAPQARGDFDALFSVLGLPIGLADKIWDEGIEQLRSDRRRAGIRMAQAFISVLVDPHGVAGGLSADVRSRIATLRSRALDHIDVVVGVAEDEGD